MRSSRKKPWFGPTARLASLPKAAVVAPYSIVMGTHNNSAHTATCKRQHTFPPLPSTLSRATLLCTPPQVTADLGTQPSFSKIPSGALTADQLSKLPVAYSPKKRKRKKTLTAPPTPEPTSPQTPAEARTIAIYLKRQKESLKRFYASPEYAAMWEGLKDLPINRNTDFGDVLEASVSMVSGETGSGKSTQVAQVLLDRMLAEGRAGSVIVTQPRRVAAVSLASRVAAERGEEIGLSIGYHTGHEKALPTLPASITFCTSGVLLRKIVAGVQNLSNTHIVLDEVHERSVDSDFLLLLLKEKMNLEDSLRLTLMSATVSFAPYRAYFAGMNYSERAFHAKPHPITEVYLDDHTSLDTVRNALSRNSDDPSAPSVITAAVAWGIEQCGNDATVLSGVASGTILVFLPGAQEIRLCAKSLRERFPDVEVLEVYSKAKREVFGALFTKGAAQRIILATNVAESSLTIAGVTLVINTGLVRESGVSDDGTTQTLQLKRCAAASNRQRAGRAGRTAPGAALHLFPRSSLSTLQDEATPEIKRSLLDSVVLTMFELNHLGLPDAFAALERCLDPPAERSIETAHLALKEAKALKAGGSGYSITRLGRRLAGLGVAPQMGRLLVYGAALGCIAPMVTFVALSIVANEKNLPPMKALKTVSCSRLVDTLLQIQSHEAAASPEHRKIIREKNKIILSLLHAKLVAHSSVTATDDETYLITGRENRHGQNEAVIRAAFTAAWGGNLFRKNGDTAMSKDHCNLRIPRMRADMKDGEWGVARHRRVGMWNGEKTVVLVDPVPTSPLMAAVLGSEVIPVHDASSTQDGLAVNGTGVLTFPPTHAQVVQGMHIKVQSALRSQLKSHDSEDYLRKTGPIIDAFAEMLWTETGERLATTVPKAHGVGLLATRQFGDAF